METIRLIPHHETRNFLEKNRVLIQVNMTYPQLSREAGDVDLGANLCFAKLAENLVESARIGMMAEAGAALEILPEALPYRIDLHFTPTWNAGGIVSFFTDVDIYAGGIRGITYRYGTIHRLRDNGPLFVTALFPPGTDICSFVAHFVADVQKIAQGLDDAQTRAVFDAAKDFFTPENVYLTDEGLSVFYPAHSLGPGAGGISVFTIPYRENGPFSPERLALP